MSGRGRKGAPAPAPGRDNKAVTRFGDGHPRRRVVTHQHRGAVCLLTLECGHVTEGSRPRKWIYCTQCPRRPATLQGP